MKKIQSLIVTAALIFTLAAPAFAASTDSVTLEKAILKVKSVINIPEEASIFEYHSWDDAETGKIWGLSWNDKNYEQYYYVTINDDGVILNFNSNTGKESGLIGSLTREQGQRKAEEFLSKVLPADMSDFRLKDSHVFEWAYSFTYILHINGFPVKNTTFSLEVDKSTGEVTNYYGNNIIKKSDKFPLPEEKISDDEAAEAFIDGGCVSLIYNSYYDYKERELNIYPSFMLDVNKFVDAVTGKIIETQLDFSPLYAYATEDSSGGAGRAEAFSLTPEEQKVVDSLAGLISREAAIRSALSKLSWLPSSSIPVSSNLSSSYIEKDKYIWHLRFEDFSISVNAKTSELISFYYFSKPETRTGKVSSSAAEKTALDFINKVAADKIDKVKFNETKSSSSNQYYSSFTRDVDGTPFPSNYISISVDLESGRIVSYDLMWYDNVNFPDVTYSMTADKAFEIYAADIDFDLLYARIESDKFALAFGFIDAPGYTLDPFSGEKLGYDGKIYKDRRTIESYDDISGKWYEETVKALLDNGYYIEGESFMGSSSITQEEFLRYMYSPVQAYYTQDDFYDMLIQNKIITAEEKSPESIVVRQDAAKYAVRFLGLDKAAKDGSIFKNPYRDRIADNYIGYAAIAKSLEIMLGDAKGNFNGEKSLIRAEAAVIIYNLLKAR